MYILKKKFHIVWKPVIYYYVYKHLICGLNEYSFTKISLLSSCSESGTSVFIDSEISV